MKTAIDPPERKIDRDRVREREKKIERDDRRKTKQEKY